MSFPVVPQNVRLNTDAPAQAAAAFFDNFTERFKQGRIESALRKVQQGDQKGLEELYAVSPEIAIRVQDQLRKQDEAERERRARAAEGQFIKDSNPGNPAVAAAIDSGADPTRLSVTQGRQTRSASSNLKNWGMAHDQVSGMLGSVIDQASYSTVKQRARQIYSDAGFDTMVSYIDTLPDVYTPELVGQLQQEAMESRDQLAHALREKRFEWDRDDDIADNTRADRNLDSQIDYRREQVRLGEERIDQSDINNQRSTQQSDTNNRRSTQQSDTNNRRTTETSRENSERSNSGRRRRGGGSGGASVQNAPEGATATDRKTGRRYIRRNGQWVPLG